MTENQTGNKLETKTSFPVPDPTVLTTQQLNREILALKELMLARNDGYDKAIKLLQERADRSPSIDVIAERVANSTAVSLEKFHSIQIQFVERDVRIEQTAKDSKVAVDAALQAAKEAVGEQNKSSALAIAKSEAATTKQIDQIGVTIQTMERSQSEKIEDLKTRIAAIEGAKAGGKEQSQSISTVVAIIAAIVGVLVPISVLIVAMSKVKTG